jgi:hypothetical protein
MSDETLAVFIIVAAFVTFLIVMGALVFKAFREIR